MLAVRIAHLSITGNLILRPRKEHFTLWMQQCPGNAFTSLERQGSAGVEPGLKLRSGRIPSERRPCEVASQASRACFLAGRGWFTAAIIVRREQRNMFRWINTEEAGLSFSTGLQGPAGVGQRRELGFSSRCICPFWDLTPPPPAPSHSVPSSPTLPPPSSCLPS